jgi:hypothetical protein
VAGAGSPVAHGVIPMLNARSWVIPLSPIVLAVAFVRIHTPRLGIGNVLVEARVGFVDRMCF